MRGSLRTTAALIALAAISFLLFTHYHHRHLVVDTGPPVSVLVAKTLIQRGTAGDVIAADALYSVKMLRLSDVPKGALVDPSILRGQVAKQDIHPGALLTAAEFGRQ